MNKLKADSDVDPYDKYINCDGTFKELVINYTDTATVVRLRGLGRYYGMAMLQNETGKTITLTPESMDSLNAILEMVSEHKVTIN